MDRRVWWRKEMRSRFLSLLLTSLLMLTGPAAIYSQQDTVIAPGDPPLTSGMIVKVLTLFEWSLDIQLSDAQRAKIAQVIAGYWRANNKEEITGTLQIVKLVDDLSKAGEAEQEKARPNLGAEILKSLRNEPEDAISRVVIEAYEAKHRTNPAKAPPAGSSGDLANNGVRVGQDGFTGIYVGTRNFSSSMSTVQLDYVTFLPGGNVYWTLPAEGLLYFDPRIAQRASPDEWGRYQVNGNAVHVTLGGGLRYVFVREGDGLKLQPHSGSSSIRTYSRLGTGDGLRLSGTYRRFTGEAGITFAKDGRFRDEGIFRNFGTMGRPDGSTYTDDGVGGTGTYVIGQNTLELRYSDGRVKRTAFTALPENLAQEPVRSFRINYETFSLN